MLEELMIHKELCSSQTNLQQFHIGFGLQDRPFLQNVIVMEFITDDLQGFIGWYVTEETDVRAIESIQTLKVNRLQQLYGSVRILNYGF
jgi:hypothetical protein